MLISSIYILGEMEFHEVFRFTGAQLHLFTFGIFLLEKETD